MKTEVRQSLDQLSDEVSKIVDNKSRYSKKQIESLKHRAETIKQDAARDKLAVERIEQLQEQLSQCLT